MNATNTITAPLAKLPHGRLGRLASTVALGLALTVTAAAARPASVSAAGSTGPYQVKVVTCQVGFNGFGTWYPGFAQVNAPNMWARNTTAAQDRQTVAWRARIVRLDGSLVTWSTWRYATAYDNSAARFSAADAVYSTKLARGSYRVIYDLYWYASSTTAAGSLSVWAPGYASIANPYLIATTCAA